MKECPFIDTCTDMTSEKNFKNFCQARFGFIVNYKHCPTYKRLRRRQQGKGPVEIDFNNLQEPREWKQEKKEK